MMRERCLNDEDRLKGWGGERVAQGHFPNTTSPPRYTMILVARRKRLG